MLSWDVDRIIKGDIMNKKLWLSLLLSASLLVTACGNKEKAENETSKSSSEKVEEVAEETEKVEYDWNDHHYVVDAVSGATVEAPSDNETTTMDEAEKEAKMHWSGRPKAGQVVGDYYHNEVVFNEGYTAVVDVVVKDEKIQLVEFDEVGPGDYYDGDWAGMNKRLSGYGFFQASKGRTDKTLVSIINTMTFLENQMIEENRLDGTFQTAKGSSNSANEGFIPAVAELAPKIKEPSKETYYAITKDLGDGLSARMVVIKDKESKKITDFRYDEYFADTRDEIKDKELQPYFRQSKFYSKDYSTESGEDFRKQVTELQEKIIKSNDLEAMIDEPTFEKNYQELLPEMVKLIAE